MEILRGKVPTWVVPTKNYIDLPCASGNTSMFHDKQLKQIRYEYYKKWYNINKKIYQKLWTKS